MNFHTASHFSLDDVPESERLHEILDGKRVYKWPSVLAGLIASELGFRLGIFVRERKLGWVVIEMLFELQGNWLQRRPDVAFVGHDRWNKPLPADDPPAWSVIPNLAIEVVCLLNPLQEIAHRIDDYFKAGVELVWVVDPQERSVWVHNTPTRRRVIRESDELDGGAVLPGFRLSVSELFAAAAKPV